jgi:hypothetical protein
MANTCTARGRLLSDTAALAACRCYGHRDSPCCCSTAADEMCRRLPLRTAKVSPDRHVRACSRTCMTERCNLIAGWTRGAMHAAAARCSAAYRVPVSDLTEPLGAVAVHCLSAAVRSCACCVTFGHSATGLCAMQFLPVFVHALTAHELVLHFEYRQPEN